MDWLKELSTLGPALGSVVVIGIVCRGILQLLDKVTDKLNASFIAMNETMGKVEKAVHKNTEATERQGRATERMADILIQKTTDYAPRQGLNPKHSR